MSALAEFIAETIAAQSKVLHEGQGQLSRDERAMVPRVTAADLLAFMDAEHADVRVRHQDGSGWDLHFTQGSFWVTAWDTAQRIQLDQRLPTFADAIEAIRRYHHELPR